MGLCDHDLWMPSGKEINDMRCFCVPDVVDVELFIISCRWNRITQGSFNDTFPKNATKSLTIQCHSEDPEAGLQSTSNIFDGFEHLRELRISNCRLGKLTDSTFQGLPKLRALHLNQINDDSTVDLDSKTFQHLNALEKLSLTHSSVENIPRGVLCSLRFLQILNISSNKISNARLGVESNDCVLDHLIILDLSHNKIRHISSNDFQPFPALRQLSLSYNGIRGLEIEAFKPIDLCQQLDLDHNHLREMVPLPDSLFHLSLAANQLPVVPSTVANLGRLLSLDLSNNHIDSSTPFSLLSTSIEVLDLSKNRLENVPIRLFKESMETMLRLNLSGNEILEVEPYLFQNFTNLKELDLSNNKIKSLAYGMFHGLGELTDLRINNNSIYHVDVEVFSELSRKLTSLSMSHNLLVELPMAVGRLTRVKHIDLSYNQITKAYKFVLNKLSHLNRLILSHNNLRHVESYVFADSSHLTDLELSHNGIDVISSDAFEKCPRLKHIDLSSNQLSKIHGSLKQVRSLRKINLSGNNLDALEWSEIPAEVQEVNASDNRIQRIHSGGEEFGVKVLDLNHNQLSSLTTDQLPNTLEELNISHNLFAGQLTSANFTGKSNLRILDLRYNQFGVVPANLFESSQAISVNFPARLYLAGNPLTCDCHMGWLTKTSNTVEIVDISVAEYFLCAYAQTCEPNCICCQYGNCDCKSKCPPGCECFHDSQFRTNVVKCRANSTNHLGKAGQVLVKELPMHASHIFLNGLDLPMLKSHDFMGRTRLTDLHITQSNLTTIQPLSFNTLPKLKTLDLSGNRLQKINGDEAFKTQHIQKLNLEQNEISDIDIRLSEIMPNLDTILLDHNSMETLPQYLNTKVAKEKLLKITLAGNPFRCDCSYTQRFQAQRWLAEKENQEKVIDLAQVYCVENVTRSLLYNDTTVLSSYPPNLGDDLFSIPMLEFIQQENRSICVFDTEGIFGGSKVYNTFLVMAIIAFLFVTAVSILYLFVAAIKGAGNSRNRYRKANSLNFSSMETAHPSMHSPQLSPQPLIPCDVFLSYSKLDEEKVINEIYRPLEQEHDLTVCLLHHDSRLYNGTYHTINDRLIRQMKACHTVILVLTKNFLESEWRNVDINVAHQLYAKENRNLIVVQDGDVSTNDLDADLGKILRQRANARLIWGNFNFWQELVKNLPWHGSPLGSEGGASRATSDSRVYSDLQYGSIANGSCGVVPSESQIV
ncbi:leucine rich repeat domain-containing protein [Ditylenchus destructor]|nr:leucine rich repeat domain-containing protein [Ditylenchus destructor]